MRYIYRQPHVREMKAVAQPDQRKSDHVMSNQLLEILPRLLLLQAQHNRLLRPITGLDQIIALEDGLVATVRKGGEHAFHTEIPNGCAFHDVDT